MHVPQGNGELIIGKSAQEARGRRRSRGGAERLDEQDLEQAGQDHVAPGPIGARLLVHEFDQGGQASLSAHVQEPRKERHQQVRIVRAERAMADDHPHIRRIVEAAEPEHAGARLDPLRLAPAGGDSRLEVVKS